MNFNLDEFISNRITKRNFSLFKSDLDANADKIKECVCDKSVLVIGGAGTIGLNFIKALLIFHPANGSNLKFTSFLFCFHDRSIRHFI